MDKKSFPYNIIYKYYPEENQLRNILLTHSELVARKALQVADKHPELALDRQFLEEASLLHDIGILVIDRHTVDLVPLHILGLVEDRAHLAKDG